VVLRGIAREALPASDRKSCDCGQAPADQIGALLCSGCCRRAVSVSRYINRPKGMQKPGIYDPTEVFNRNEISKNINECSIKLGFYLLCFFYYLYRYVAAQCCARKATARSRRDLVAGGGAGRKACATAASRASRCDGGAPVSCTGPCTVAPTAVA